MKRETLHKDSKRSARITFLEGRPVRKHAINNEDLVNLKIALETCKTLEEFLQRTQ